ncbi:LysR family transcriptional regulator [Maricaulis sp. W15]|uniref:LysR family transcriptional regulator n=1 Tax=Maricaulis sp. W15 TaxID=1772333 RepID=UPI000948B8C4|nr:LysR family transcriptional regulator [Maricaulis sp. W15]OLF81516.1 LysR family transcriptional regulator [Maricaulis sp. W15]
MDRIDALRLFCSVAELGSFTKAADREGMTPGAASKQITALEERLQARLFERTTRSVRLTDAGDALLDRVRPWLDEYDGLEQGVADARSAPAGVLRVSAPVDFGARRLMPIITQFMTDWPGVEIRLSLADRMVDLVNEGFDVGVRIGNLPDSALIAKQLAPACMSVVASPAYLARAGTPQHPSELAGHEMVIDRNKPAPQMLKFLQGEDEVDVRIHGRLSLNGAVAAVTAAEAGVGIACSPRWAAERAIAEGRVVEILTDWESENRFLWAVFPSNRYLAHRVRLFVDFLALQFTDRI